MPDQTNPSNLTPQPRQDTHSTDAPAQPCPKSPACGEAERHPQANRPTDAQVDQWIAEVHKRGC